MALDLAGGELKKALGTLKDTEDNDVKVEKSILLPADRCDIYVEAFPEKKLAVKGCTLLQCSATNEEGDKVDHIVKVTQEGKGSEVAAELVMTECKIMYEDCSPTQLVEYSFEDGLWHLSPISQGALESYRKAKYKLWKDMITAPTCEAQFKRMLKIGLINRMYDDMVFKTPDKDMASYEVLDDHGKKVRIPHPVSALRIWDAEEGAYKTVSAELEGAPTKPEEVKKVWAELIESFKAKLGAEFVEKCLL